MSINNLEYHEQLQYFPCGSSRRRSLKVPRHNFLSNTSGGAERPALVLFSSSLRLRSVPLRILPLRYFPDSVSVCVLLVSSAIWQRSVEPRLSFCLIKSERRWRDGSRRVRCRIINLCWRSLCRPAERRPGQDGCHPPVHTGL